MTCTSMPWRSISRNRRSIAAAIDGHRAGAEVGHRSIDLRQVLDERPGLVDEHVRVHVDGPDALAADHDLASRRCRPLRGGEQRPRRRQPAGAEHQAAACSGGPEKGASAQRHAANPIILLGRDALHDAQWAASRDDARQPEAARLKRAANSSFVRSLPGTTTINWMSSSLPHRRLGRRHDGVGDEDAAARVHRLADLP